MIEPTKARMQPTLPASHIAGGVLVLTLAAGATSFIWGVTDGTISLDSAAWTFQQIMDGESAVRLADELGASPLPVALSDLKRGVAWIVSGSLDSSVRRGCDPWLFLEDELTVHPARHNNMAQRLSTVTHLHDLLRSRGIQLVVATVPDKSRIQHEDLCQVYRPVSSAGRLGTWEEQLTQNDIAHASLLSPLKKLTEHSEKEQPFLKVDTHWTQQGAQAAAQAIAEKIAQMGVQLTPRQDYTLAYGKPVEQQGDLVRLAGIDWLPARLLPPPDIAAPARVERSDSDFQSTDLNQNKDDELDLFGDANLPSTALIGTSFSRSSSFSPFLEHALHTPVPSFALDGGDFWKSAQKYLESNEFRDTPPKIIIWEIPERVLEMPISQDERAWMSSLEKD